MNKSHVLLCVIIYFVTYVQPLESPKKVSNGVKNEASTSFEYFEITTGEYNEKKINFIPC